MSAVTEKLFLLLAMCQMAFGSNILYMAPSGSPSHHIWNRELALGLVEKGHNITMLTHQPKEERASRNFTFITIEGFLEILAKNFDMQGAAEASVLTTIKVMYDFTEITCAYGMESEGLRTLLNYPKDKFDLIIIDVTLIQLNFLPPLLSNSFGNHIFTSYMPYFSSEFTNQMSFSERILNFIFVYSEYLYQRHISQPRQFKIAQQGFGDDIASFDELEKNMSLLLTNVDPNLDYPMALPPNIIPVGGLHISPPKGLPEDLQNIFSAAQHGVILFSLGTNVRSDQLNLETRKVFLDAFSKLPQIVLWKFESNISGLPKNVIIRKWLPQRDTLGHPNTKLFISQCGGFSSQEAVYHGVPVIGIPFLIDHYTIVKRMVERKLGKPLYYWNLTSNNIYETINEVLNNPIYKENILRVSKRYRDQPQTALERAIFWIEYVMHHGGTDHLVLPSRHMPGYQTANLDVLLVFILALIAVYSIISVMVMGCRLIARTRGFSKSKLTK